MEFIEMDCNTFTDTEECNAIRERIKHSLNTAFRQENYNLHFTNHKYYGKCNMTIHRTILGIFNK